MEKNQILTTDSLAVLASLPDQSIDAVITDPPYPNGMGLFTEQLVDGIAGLYLAAKKAKKHVIFFWSPVIDPPQPPPGYFETARHIWGKPDAKSRIGYELVVAWSRDYHRQPYRVWSVPILDLRSLKDWKQHPTQKPLRLLRLIVSMYTQPGDLILDPFAGTGTTGVAAKQLNRDYLLIESNKEYAEFAQQRLQEPAVAEPTEEEPKQPVDDEPRPQKSAKAKR